MHIYQRLKARLQVTAKDSGQEWVVDTEALNPVDLPTQPLQLWAPETAELKSDPLWACHCQQKRNRVEHGRFGLFPDSPVSYVALPLWGQDAERCQT